MHYRNKDLIGRSVHASDGAVGRVKDVYFDDRHWTVRYLVVGIGRWIQRRQVLVAPTAFDTCLSHSGALQLGLTRRQVASCPGADADRPVACQQRHLLRAAQRPPLAWGRSGFWGFSGVPLDEPMVEARRGAPDIRPRPPLQPDAHLRSCNEITGYQIHTDDGAIGHTADFVIDPVSWRISDLLVDTGEVAAGQAVALPPRTVRRLSWSERKVHVGRRGRIGV